MEAVLFAAVAPLALWPIEIFFPYPHIVEELAKAVLVFFILKSPQPRDRFVFVCLAGGFFAFSESVLYLFNISLVGSLETVFTRLLLTFLLHAGTMLVMLFFACKHRSLLVLGLGVAMILHYFFNSWMVV